MVRSHGWGKSVDKKEFLLFPLPVDEATVNISLTKLSPSGFLSFYRFVHTKIISQVDAAMSYLKG